MRIIYSERVNQLSKILDPYWVQDGMKFYIKEDAPEEIKQAEKEWRELMNKEYMDAMGY